MANFEINDKAAFSITDEDAHLIIQDGSVAGGATRKLKLTELADFIFGTVKDARDLENVSNIPPYNRLMGIENVAGTSYTLSLSNDGYLIKTSNAGAINITVPANASVAFSDYTVIHIVQGGAGQITLVEDTGVTINKTDTLKSRTQHSWLSLCKVATNTWHLTGDVEAV